MGILSSLFGNSNVVTKAADGIYDGLDAAIYTDEEKVENRKAFLKLYEPFKIAQRLLALIFGVPYALGWFITFICSFFVDDVTYQLELLSGPMGEVVLAIVAFYFLGGVVNGIPRRSSKN